MRKDLDCALLFRISLNHEDPLSQAGQVTYAYLIIRG